MYMIKTFLIAFVFIIIGCSPSNNNDTPKKDVPPLPLSILETSQNDTTPKTNTHWADQITILIDSIKSQNLENTDRLIFGINSFIDTTAFYFEPHLLSVEYLEKMVNYNSFNGNALYWINHNHGSKEAYSTMLFLINDDDKVIAKDTLLSNRYELGQINILDWNNDGQDELQYLSSNIGSSVPIIGKYETIYAFDNNSNQFQNIFQIEYDYRNCDPTTPNILIKQSYQFISDQKIKVQKSEYSINCDSFEWEGDIKGIKKKSTKSYILNWNEQKKKFTDR